MDTSMVNNSHTELERQINVVKGRLDTGLPLIQDAIAQGRDVSASERKWIDLLHEYERLYDRLVAAEKGA